MRSREGEGMKLGKSRIPVRLNSALLATLWAIFAVVSIPCDIAHAAQATSEPRMASEAQADVESDRQDQKQEQRDQQQEHAERMQELYSNGRGYLDEEDYGDAVRTFSELAEMNGPQTDAALYWKAYAQNRQGKREAALSTAAELKHRFPQSRWKKDAEALEIEMKQRSGATVNPDSQSNEDLKFLALQGILNSDPEHAMPIIQKYLDGAGSPKEKSKALFLLAQSGSPQAHEVLKKIALGQSNPELQRKAVEYLGMMGGKGTDGTLAEIYASSKDPEIKRAVIRGYMVSGDHEHLFALAKSEKDESLKRDAIRSLGLSGGRTELLQLYQADTSTEARKDILEALFLSGDSQKLTEIAVQEKNPELRRAAIRDMGLMGGKQPELQSIYMNDSDRGVKEEVLNAYFLGGNANGLIAVARTEKDTGLKKKAVEKLSLMNSKEATNYLMELLDK